MYRLPDYIENAGTVCPRPAVYRKNRGSGTENPRPAIARECRIQYTILFFFSVFNGF